jgi:isopenicillin-N N-acyltransferase-like protein
MARIKRPVWLLLWLLAVLPVGLVACSRSSGTATAGPTPAVIAKAAPAAQEIKGTVSTLGQGKDAVKLLHVWGSPREMGYAHGKLLKNEIADFYSKIIGAMSTGMGVPVTALDDAWAQMEPFVPKQYLEEMEGLAEGAGVELQTVKRAHAIPDLSEMDCTFFAAWGDFTKDGHLIQLRALDYATEAHIQDNPAIVVYHPADGPAYVNVGWCGFIGMVTGMNARKICMSEIGDDFDKDKQTLKGEPMPFVMRDVISRAEVLDQGVAIVQNAKRTSSFLYLIGDGKVPNAKALKTGPATFEVYDQTSIPYGALGNAVWMSMGADSDWNQKIRTALEGLKGNLTVDSAMKDVTSKCKTGDLHTVYFDATDLKLWVANADVDASPAYDQGFVTFDFGAATERPEQ